MQKVNFQFEEFFKDFNVDAPVSELKLPPYNNFFLRCPSLGDIAGAGLVGEIKVHGHSDILTITATLACLSPISEDYLSSLFKWMFAAQVIATKHARKSKISPKLIVEGELFGPIDSDVCTYEHLWKVKSENISIRETTSSDVVGYLEYISKHKEGEQ